MIIQGGAVGRRRRCCAHCRYVPLQGSPPLHGNLQEQVPGCPVRATTGSSKATCYRRTRSSKSPCEIPMREVAPVGMNDQVVHWKASRARPDIGNESDETFRRVTRWELPSPRQHLLSKVIWRLSPLFNGRTQTLPWPPCPTDRPFPDRSGPAWEFVLVRSGCVMRTARFTLSRGIAVHRKLPNVELHMLAADHDAAIVVHVRAFIA